VTDAHPATAGFTTMGDVARTYGRLRPNRLALAYEDRVTDFATLDRVTNQVANGLLAAGLSRQARVAFLDKNSDTFFEMWLGAAKAGMVIAAVNWRLAPPEIAFVIEDSGAEALVIGADFLGVLPALGALVERLKLVLVVDAPAGHQDARAWIARQDTVDPKVAVGGGDVAIQLYTSGTTGLPKGAMLSHANILAGGRIVAQGALGRWGEDELYLECLPIFHVGGACTGFNTLFVGGGVVILREFEPTKVLDSFAAWPITKAGLVPAMQLILLQHPRCAETDFGRLDTIYYGASPIPLELLKRALATFRCGFIQLYGMTETTGPAVALQPEDHDPAGTARMRSAGRALPGVGLRVVGPGDRDVPVGEVGEILLKGDIVMVGYWKRPEATAASIADGWMHTGDAGYLDADGYVYVHDRVKDMIVSGGENVYPAEVESALFGHPAIADVAVIGVPDEKWGEAVKAVVVLKPGAEVGADDLIAHARARIAGYKCPKSVDFVEVLPRNPSGKLLKRELREPYWAGRERRVN
jgi:long-chain acyl-CoA synthetase